jgi:hypothetical protein
LTPFKPPLRDRGRELEIVPISPTDEIVQRTKSSLLRRFQSNNPQEGIAKGTDFLFETIILNSEEADPRPNLPVTINYYFKYGSVGSFFNFRNPLLEDNQWETFRLDEAE